MHKILVIQPVSHEALALLDGRSDISFEIVTDFAPSNLLARVEDADAITIRDAQLPIEVLEKARRLKVVSRHGVGYDNIPIDYCTGRGIPVTVVGPVNAISVAEQALLLMLAVARQAVLLDRAVRAGDFAARGRVKGIELRGKRLLLIGFGIIGKEVAKRASSLGMDILVFDPFASRDAQDVAYFNRLEDALPQADVVSLHVPLTTETRNLLGDTELALLPAGAIVINTARGGLIDEDALLKHLDEGHLHGAGLDTFATEPLPATSPLASHERIVLSPHSAALTGEALRDMGLMTIRNALAGLEGALDPALVVNRSVLPEASNAI